MKLVFTDYFLYLFSQLEFLKNYERSLKFEVILQKYVLRNSSFYFYKTMMF